MCAGDPIRPPCYLQNLEPFLEIPTTPEKKKWPIDANPSVDYFPSAPLEDSFLFTYARPRDVESTIFPEDEQRFEPKLPFLSHCVSSSNVELVDEEKEATTIRQTCRCRPESDCKHLPSLTLPNGKVESKNVFKSVQYCRVYNDLLKTISALLNFGHTSAKVRAQNLCKFSPLITSNSSLLLARKPNISLRQNKETKISNFLRDAGKRNFKSLLNEVESTKTYMKLKLVPQNLKKKIPECFKQNYFKKRKNENDSQWLKSRENLNKAERLLKTRLKRFRKFRKGLKERFKSHTPVPFPVDAEHHNGKGGRSFDSKGEDFTSSKNKSINPKRSSLPNLFCRKTSRASSAGVKSSGRNYNKIPYVDLKSSCDEGESRPATTEVKEYFGKRSKDTIKLIDKFLEKSPCSSMKPCQSKGSRPQMGDKNHEARSLSMEEGEPFSAVRKSELDHYTKKTPKERHSKVSVSTKISLSADESDNKGKSTSVSDKKYYHRPLAREQPTRKVSLGLQEDKDDSKVLKTPTERVHRPTTLFIKSSIPSIKLSQNSPADDDDNYSRVEGFSASLDSIRYNNHSSTLRDELPTSDLLKRLDSVLSEIVEQEKKKIQQCENLKSNRSADNLLLLPSQRPVRRKPRKQQKDKKVNQKDRESHYVKLPRSSMVYSDILNRHKTCFTESKPCRPRIVKSESQSKLLSMRCYHPPRPKHNRKKVMTKRKSFDDWDQAYSESFGESSSPSSENDSQEIGDKNTSKDSFEEEFSSLSASLPSAKETKIERYSQADDEDDTCYGSDHISSDMIDRGDPASKFNFPHKPSKPGECSIDSAFTESREETPDLHTSDQMFDFIRDENRSSYTPSPFEIDPREYTSVVKLINDSKKYILDKIKESRSYSDEHINQLLAHYSKKWKNIPEREMNIIVRSIRADLGVRASPKECIEFLSGTSTGSNVKGSSCQNLNRLDPNLIPLRKEVSKEDIIADLTTTLPQYLKVHQWNRKTLSTSSSPEPSLNYFSARGSPGYFTNRSSHNIFGAEGLESPPISSWFQKTEAVKEIKKDSEYQVEQIDEEKDLINAEEIDEEWIKGIVGEATFKEMEAIINEIKTQGLQAEKSDPRELEEMANEICRQFSITF